MNTMLQSADKDLYAQIKKEITSKDSVVGIDAVHTHILILERLIRIEEKITELQRKLELVEAGRQ